MLAQLARGTMRGKIPRLEEALDCSFFTGEHAAVLAMMLVNIDHYTAQIDQLDREDRGAGRAVPAPDRPAGRRSPASGVICAQDIIAEIGVDMSVFPTAAHLVSWARWSPAGQAVRRETQGQQRHRPRQPLPRRPPSARPPISAGRTQTFLGAKYRRLSKRMPKKKALVATGNSMLTIVHALLSDPDAEYPDLGADYYEQRMHTRRQARNHVRSLERLGYKVTIEAINPDTGEAADRSRLTRQPRSPGGADAPPGAAARPAEVLFSGQPLVSLRATPYRRENGWRYRP